MVICATTFQKKHEAASNGTGPFVKRNDTSFIVEVDSQMMNLEAGLTLQHASALNDFNVVPAISQDGAAFMSELLMM
jgi:hypothetical protein